MAKKTLNLIKEIGEVLNDVKVILLEGGIGVGKTYIAKELAQYLKIPKFVSFSSNGKKVKESNVITEIVSISQSYSYEDFLYGMVTNIKSSKINFEYKDKIFLNMIGAALSSWEKKENDKYVLILDDINRGLITDILGEAITLMEPHGNNSYRISLKNGRKIDIPPNFYIIATLNNVIEKSFKLDYALLRRFHKITINSDFSYLLENEENNGIEKVDAYTLYEKIKRIVTDNLYHQYNSDKLQRDKYIIGHGFFSGTQYLKKVKSQVIPLLKQYRKDEILEKEADIAISNLEENIKFNFTTSTKLVDNNRIKGTKEGVTPKVFIEESATHKPIINIVARIKEQGLISDADIENEILFNRKILYREAIINSTFYSATLYASAIETKNLKVGERALYKREKIEILNLPYYVAGEMQPKEFTRWDDEFLKEDYINKRQSTSPNSILFFIIKKYYKAYILNCDGYLNENNDENILLLKNYAETELGHFIEKYKGIKPLSGLNIENQRANDQVRLIIANLKLLWSNKGDTIQIYHDKAIVVKGVYKMNNTNKYKEYLDTMDSLKINQMILQGPPGTSKTHSTREFLKFVGGDLDENELNEYQIKSYNQERYCDFLKKNNNKTPSIAWDIVQFHPSYGYEDFIRGIEVSTTENFEVVYDTVNKVLGKMADLAYKAKISFENNEADTLTKFFLVVDEINRANLATVFGELIYGLEYRGEGVATPYSVGDTNKLLLPDNLYIIGTMNTADKSIGGIDYAIRRRFLFFSLLPDPNVIKNYCLNQLQGNTLQNQKELNEKAYNLFNIISRLFTENLNNDYYKEDVQIGHTYFLVDNLDQLFKRFKYQIIPILREYSKDGMFQFDNDEYEVEGWKGFLNCITGIININDDDVIQRIFNDLIKEEI